MIKYLCVFTGCLVSLWSSAQTRYHVSNTATGSQTGLSWTDAFTDLQAALTLAEAGDTVWVAEGTYLPTSTTERTKSFEPRSGVRLIGGFSGTENIENQRNWNAHATVLSGDIGTPGDSTDNAYNVVYLELPDSNTVIDGFTIRDGNADYSQQATARDRRRCGGGMYINGTDWEAYPNIFNCRFVNNTARGSGGGMYINGAGDGSVAPQVVNCEFERNRSLGTGGALTRLGGSWLERKDDLKGCLFNNNKAGSYGGAFYYSENERSDYLNIICDTFFQNEAALTGAVFYFLVGRNQNSFLSIDSCFLRGNAQNGTEAIYLSSNFLYMDSIFIENSTLHKNGKEALLQNTVLFNISIFGHANFLGRFSKNTISENNAPRLMAFESIEGSFLLNGNKISGNRTNKNIVQILSSRVIVTNNVLENCWLTGAIFDFYSSESVIKNNYLNSLNFYPSNNISLFLADNYKKKSLIEGLSIINTSLSAENSVYAPDSLIVVNSIISGNTRSLLKANHYAYVSHCAFDAPDCSWFPSNAVCGPGNLFGLDPLFADTANGDFHLLPCSPLLDAGSNDFVTSATDLNGDPRIQGGTVDIGALESPPFQLAAEPVVGPSCPGGASGTVAFDVQNACEPISLYWAGPGNESGSGINGLPAGAYSVTLTDARGRSVVAPLVVPVGDAPVLNSVSTPVVCGDTLGGSATVSVEGAATPLAFSWQNSSNTDSLRTDLPAGTYLLTVTDALGCTATGSVTVGRTGSLDLDFDIQNVSCYGAADGSLEVLPANGKAPFEWQWGNGITAPFLAGLGPGQYPGSLTDALGCSIAWSLPVSEPAQLVLTGAVTPATDSSSADGSIVLEADGGTQPYSVLWSTEDDLWALYNLQPGAYAATLTDGNGCQLDSTFVVGVVSGTSDIASNTRAVSWPNPVVSTLYFQSHNAVIRQVVLRDAQGREVRRRSASDTYTALDVSDLSAGVYIWEMWLGEASRATGRVVKQ